MSFEPQAERVVEMIFRDAERLHERMAAGDPHRAAVQVLRDNAEGLLALIDASRIVGARITPVPPPAPLFGAPVDYLDV